MRSSMQSWLKILIALFIVTVLGGVIGYATQAILSPVQEVAGQWANIVVLGVLFVLMVALFAKFKTFMRMNWLEVLTMFVGIAFTGSILTAFLPVLAPYILSVNFTLTGLAWTVIYIAIAEFVMDKLKIR